MKRRGLEASLVWGLWAAGVLGVLSFTLAFSANIPAWDEWDFVPAYTGAGPGGVGWLWEQHFEYRMPYPKLVFTALGRATGYDFRGPALVSAVGLAVLAAFLLVAARRIRGRSRYTDALIPLLLLHPGHHQVLIENDYLVYVLTMVAFGAVLVAMARPAARRSGADGWLAAAGLAALPLCGALGMALLPPLLVWVWRERGNRRVAAGGVVAALVFVAYLAGYRAPAGEPPVPAVPGVLACALQFLACGFGPAGSRGWPASGLAAAGVLVAAAEALLRVRGAGRWRNTAPWLCVLAAVALAALAVGEGRAGLGSGAGLANRYGPVAALVLCAAYLGRVAAGEARWLAPVLLLVAALALPFNVSAGVDAALGRKAVNDAFLAELRSGVPPRELARHWWPAFYYSEGELARRMEMLAKARLGPFTGATTVTGDVLK